jgi:hypothetical protein
MSSPLVAIVDDEASVQQALTRLLPTAGLRVLTYASATEFLHERKVSLPDCKEREDGRACATPKSRGSTGVGSRTP